MHHAVLDGKTIHLFLQTRARTCQSRGTPELKVRPFYDRSDIKDLGGRLKRICTSHWLDLEGPNNRSLMCLEKFIKVVLSDLVRGTFQLTREDIEKLRRLVKTHLAKQDHEQHYSNEYISTFSLTYAYVWFCLANVEGILNNEVDQALLVFVVDFRSRLNPPVP